MSPELKLYHNVQKVYLLVANFMQRIIFYHNVKCKIFDKYTFGPEFLT